MSRYPQIPLPKDEDVLHMLEGCKLVKERVAALRLSAMTEDELAVWLLQKMYSRQTTDEQSQEVTVYANKVGFSAFDAEILSSFAKQFSEHGSLSPKQMGILHKRIPAYAVQVEKTMRAN